MSANILRELVGKFFEINPSNVALSGEISPTMSFTGNSCWSSSSNETSYYLWGFSPEKGFVSLQEYVGNWSNSESGEQNGENGTPINEIENVEEYLFFLVNEDYKSGNGDNHSYGTWTIYKAPDFKTHWDKVKEKDTKRWEKWLGIPYYTYRTSINKSYTWGKNQEHSSNISTITSHRKIEIGETVTWEELNPFSIAGDLNEDFYKYYKGKTYIRVAQSKGTKFKYNLKEVVTEEKIFCYNGKGLKPGYMFPGAIVKAENLDVAISLLINSEVIKKEQAQAINNIADYNNWTETTDSIIEYSDGVY